MRSNRLPLDERLGDLLATVVGVDEVALAPLYVRTAWNMQLRQLSGVGARTLRQAVLPRLPIDFDARYESRIPDSMRTRPTPVKRDTERHRASLSTAERRAHRARAYDASLGRLSLLNQSIEFDGNAIDWEHPEIDEQPLLWRLKLQSLVFLRWLVFGFERPAAVPPALFDWAIEQVDDWYCTHRIDEPGYLRRNWIPHSVSLRLLNLTRFAAWADEGTRDEAWRQPVRRAIHKNAQFLSNHVEHDIGGNHLIENAVALVTAGVFLRNEAWVEQGLTVFSTARNQFLDDGGHFERSPMYHIQTVHRYLTALSVLRGANLTVPSWLEDVAVAGVEFLQTIRPPDDRIPLFNDAVFGQSLTLAACIDYAETLGVLDRSDGPRRAAPDTGYYWLGLPEGDGGGCMLVDGGPVGPRHLPAHSHNDLLSYVFWADGTRVLTDTGTYGYASDNNRTAARSVQAHNTVQVGPLEPIPLGGQYLMGARTEPVVETRETDDVSALRGTYRRRSRGQRYRHQRAAYHAAGWWLVRDSVAGTDLPSTSRVHVHPRIRAVPTDDSGRQLSLLTEDGPLCHLTSLGETFDRNRTPYFPRFGVRKSRDSVEVTFNSDSPTTAYLLSRERPTDVRVTRADGQLERLHVDGRRWRLPTW